MKETNPEVYEDLMKRMKRIEGQARGIQRMLDEGEECENILTQLAAMKSALHRVGLKMLGCHLGNRIAEEVRSGGTGNTSVEEALETFLRLG